MALDESWDVNEQGQVKFAALTGYSMATFPRGGMVRLEYAESVEDLHGGKSSGVQLHVTAPLARELGEALRRLADSLDAEAKAAPQA